MAINFGQGAPGGQSAAEVLSYKGDAGLAGGFDSSGLPAGSGANSLSTVDDMLKTVNQNQFVRNTLKYKQAIDDRDKTLNLMNDPELLMAHDIMDQDRDALDKERTLLLDTLKENPKLINDPAAFVEYKKKMGNFMEMAKSSKSRNIEYKRQMQAIAADPNVESRNARLAHLDKQIKNGVLHQIDPYFANPTFDSEKYFKEVPAAQVGEVKYVIGEDGAAKAMKVMATPVTAFKAPFSPQNLMANGGMGLQDIQILHDNFVSSPFAKDENYIRSINEKLNKINTENNLGPSDPNYFKPIAVQEGEAWKITDSPADLAAALYAYKGYKRQEEQELSKDYQKQVLDFQKTQADLAKDKQAVLTAKALAEQYRANAKLARERGETEVAKREESNAEMAAPVADAINGFTDAMNAKNYKTLSSLPTSLMPPTLRNIIIENGYDINSKVAILPKEQKYIKMLSDMGVDDNGKASGIIKKPVNIYAVKTGDDIGSVKLFGFDKSNNLIKSVDVTNGIDEIVKYNQGYDMNDDIHARIESARRVMKEQLSARSKPAEEDVNVANIPAPVKKVAAGANVEVVPDPATGQEYYMVNGLFYDNTGNQVK